MASNLGRVRSVDRTCVNSKGINYTRKGKILAQFTRGTKKYLHVAPVLGGKYNNSTVHRMVCDAFIGPIPPEMEVNHIDMNTLNNRIENLEYVTHRENNIKRFVGKKRGVVKYRGSWKAQFWDGENGRLIYIKSFKNKEEAYAAYYNFYTDKHGVAPW
jgi:hypothetical protein